MHRRSILGDCGKTVSRIFIKLNDLGKCLGSSSFGIGVVHKHHHCRRRCSAFSYVVHYLVHRNIVPCGISRIGIPVKIRISLFLHQLRKLGHNSFAVAFAYGIGGAAGKTNDAAFFADYIFHRVAYFLKVGKKCVGGSVYIVVFVTIGVKGYGVSLLLFPFNKLQPARTAYDKKCGLNTVFFKNIKNSFGVV